MMKRLFFFLILVSIGCNSILAQQIRFQRVYGGDSYDVGKEVIQASDDGYFVVGSTGSFGLEDSQIMLFKTDSLGDLEWRRFYGGSLADQAEAMVVSLDGNLLVCGFSETTDKSYQAFVLKVNMQGDTIWTRYFGGDVWDFAKELVPLSDGGCAVFGQTYSYGNGNGDYYLLRLNSDGDTLWTRTYGGSEMESGESIATISDGGFVLAGFTESYGEGKADSYIIRTDSNGDTLWTKTFGGAEDEYCYGVAVTDGDAILMAGGTFNNTPDESDFALRKIDENGVVVWDQINNGTITDSWTNVSIQADGKILCIGNVAPSNEHGQEDVRMERLSPGGWYTGLSRSYGTHKDDRGFDVKQTSDGGYIMVGHTTGFLERYEDIYLAKLDSDGYYAAFTVDVNEVVIEDEVFEVSFGPNPFSNEVATVFIQDYLNMRSKVDGKIMFRMYGGVGQMVYETEIISSQTQLQSLNIAGGIYAYQLINKKSVMATGKAVKLD